MIVIKLAIDNSPNEKLRVGVKSTVRGFEWLVSSLFEFEFSCIKPRNTYTLFIVNLFLIKNFINVFIRSRFLSNLFFFSNEKAQLFNDGLKQSPDERGNTFVQLSR